MGKSLLFLSASIMAVLAIPAHAADYTWDGGAGTTDWLAPLNWSANVLPMNGDVAIIDTPAVVTLTNPGATASSVRISTSPASNTSLTVSDAGQLNSDTLQVSILGTGLLTVQNGGTVISNSLFAGQFGGSNGTIEVSSGGNITSTTLRIGNSTNSTGTMRILNGGLVNGTSLFVGNSGSGILRIEDGGVGNFTNVNIERLSGTNGSAVVTGNGSELNSSGTIVIAQTGNGTLTVEQGGTVNNTADTYVSLFGGSNGTLEIQNGGHFSGNNVYIGANTNATGTTTVTGVGSTLAYTGNLRVGGAGTGILTVADSADVSGGTLRIANNAGSTGTVNIGAAAGSPAAAAGTLSVSSVSFGPGTGVINFNHTGTNYSFAPALVGLGTVNTLSGSTTLTGNNSGFTGSTNVSGGELVVNGTLGGALTSSGTGRIRGSGILSQLAVNNGGTAAPGNSIGTLNAINVTFNSGSIYEVELNALGQSDLISASGTATLNGGTVNIVPYPDYALNTVYTILTATGGVTGAFDATTAPLLDALLTYDANNVYVSLSPSMAALMQSGRTPNQIATALGAASVPLSNAAITALYASPDAASTRAALDLLSGEIHASTTNTLLRGQDQLRSIIPVWDDRNKGGSNRVWVKAFGNRAHTDDTSNTASLNAQSGGVVTGVEHTGENVRYGFALGAGQTNQNQDARASKASVDSLHALIYTGKTLPKTGVTFDSGLSASFHEIETKRTLQIGNFNQTSKADYNAQTYQLFGEAGRPIKIREATTVTPYAQAAYTLQHSGSFKESGAAGLKSKDDFAQLPSTVIGTRIEQKMDFGNIPFSIFHVGMGWQHYYGDLDGKRTMSFKDSSGEQFSIKSAPLNQDSFLLNTGLRFQLNKGANFSFSYDVASGKETTAQSINGSIDWNF